MGCGCHEHGKIILKKEYKPSGDAANVRNWLCKFYLALLKRKKRGDPCLYLPEDVINKPDPAIYSQFLLMELGQPVTWDNPDVAIFLGGVEQYTYDLRVNTEYDITVTVHNSSRTKAATNTLVHLRWIEFGAGAQIRHAISTISTNVPVFPGVSKVTSKWRTPASAGHYCIEVELEHPEDANTANNLGWNNTQVREANSEVRSVFRVYNRYPDGCPPVYKGGYKTRVSQILGYTVIFSLIGFAYAFFPKDGNYKEVLTGFVVGGIVGAIVGFIREKVVGSMKLNRSKRRHEKMATIEREKVSCNWVEIFVDGYLFKDAKGKEAHAEAMFAPKPTEWPARVEPNTFVFNPGEAFRDVILIVDAPDEAGPPANFNCNVWQGGVPSGGITVTINR